MPNIQKISIFLASPSDVQRERKYVREVIDEINRTVAPDKGVFLEVVASERAIPGYGKDGQNIINEQIGDMQKHDLFVGIMWNRIGKPTPRDISGTVEEFSRAVKTWQRKKKPDIWFYFRKAPADLTTKEELDQKAGVIAFKKKLGTRGLYREYTTPLNFSNQFREHIVGWINNRSNKSLSVKGKRSSAGASSSTTLSKGDEQKASNSSRKPATRSSTNRNVGVVKNPRNWIMLNNQFYQSTSVAVQADKTIVLTLSLTSTEQIAELRSFQLGELVGRRQVSYADEHLVGVTSVQSITSETRSGKTIFTITLSALPSQGNNLSTEFSFQNYNVDDIANLRAKWILLGQPFPREIEYLTSLRNSMNSRASMPVDTLPRLWATLKTTTSSFLPKAWLQAVYLLKTNDVVESIQTLELGPIKGDTFPIKFQGRRHRRYTNHDPATISIEGECRREM